MNQARGFSMNKQRGFGLIDVAIAICIIALILSFVIPVYKTGESRQKYGESVLMLKKVSEAMEKHFLETGSYPVFDNFADFAMSENTLISEEYLSTVPAKDAFGRPFQGKSDGQTYELQGMSIISFNEKLVANFPDYTFKTGAKFVQKGVDKG